MLILGNALSYFRAESKTNTCRVTDSLFLQGYKYMKHNMASVLGQERRGDHHFRYWIHYVVYFLRLACASCARSFTRHRRAGAADRPNEKKINKSPRHLALTPGTTWRFLKVENLPLRTAMHTGAEFHLFPYLSTTVCTKYFVLLHMQQQMVY